MTITKLDNIFNLIAQAMPEVQFYHMGFMLDINDSDFRNNFNAPTGAANEVLTRKMPAIYFTPPRGQFQAGLRELDDRGFIPHVSLRSACAHHHDSCVHINKCPARFQG